MGNKNEYLNLMKMSYEEALNYLLEKYGAVDCDYFSEYSYNRLLEGKIKSIEKKKSKNKPVGVQTHHMEENIFLDMSKKSYIINQKIPFKFQKKERLVYCDLFEHAILHALITKETNRNFGLPGLSEYILPRILDMFLLEVDLTREWAQKERERAYLPVEEALEVINVINAVIPGLVIPNAPKNLEEIEKMKRKKQRFF